MEAMRALLGRDVRGLDGPTVSQTPPSTNSPMDTSVITPSHAIKQHIVEPCGQTQGTLQTPTLPDVVDRGILTLETAEELLETFKSKCNTKFPILNIPPAYTVDSLRQNHKVLFLAGMAAAAGIAHPELYSVLNTEAMQEYANASMVRNEKSLELVQAMLTSVLWYVPMGTWSQMKFYEYIHYASTMAADLGLGEDGLANKVTPGLVGELSSTWQLEPLKPSTAISPAIDIENARTWLSCYFQCASWVKPSHHSTLADLLSVAISMRRDNMLPYNGRMTSCITKLETSPLRIPSDSHLIALVKLVHIAEQISSSYDLPNGEKRLTLSSSRNSQVREHFRPQLASWRRLHNGLDFNSETLLSPAEL